MLGGNYGGGDSSFVYSADGTKAVAAAIYVDIFDNNSGGGGKRGDGGFLPCWAFYLLQAPKGSVRQPTAPCFARFVAYLRRVGTAVDFEFCNGPFGGVYHGKMV